MNRRAFIKGLMATSAAVAAPMPAQPLASGGLVAGGIDLGAGDRATIVMLSRKNGKSLMSWNIIEHHIKAGLAERSGIGLPSRLHRFDSDGPLQLVSPLRRDATVALIRSGESERVAVNRASRRAGDFFMRGAA